MRLRKKRCVLITSFWIVSFILWKWFGSSNEIMDDKAALTLLHPEHLAEDSKHGILYHHKSHKGFERNRTANSTWIRNLLFPFETEWLSASMDENKIDWGVTENWMKDGVIHPAFDSNIVKILRKMATAPIIEADIYPKGTQLKLLLTLDGGQKVIFKPKWYDNDFVLLGEPYVGKDRHYAEIAGFHLNRLLEFARIPLVVGRRIDMVKELLPVMTKRLNETLYLREMGIGLPRICFYGKCYYCKGPSTGVCGDNNAMIDGALILHLPKNVQIKRHAHPWRRTYVEDKKAQWESDDGYCDKVLQNYPSWLENGRLLDLIDASIYDFLTGNADRHHYETLDDHKNRHVLLMDTGKGFGNPYIDEISILAPLTQCCKIRHSTWKRVDQLSHGQVSEAMRRLLQNDPLAPVLSELNLEVIDRRINIVKTLVHQCISRKGFRTVLID